MDVPSVSDILLPHERELNISKWKKKCDNANKYSKELLKPMLRETRNLAEELAKKNAEIQWLRVSMDNFNVHSYKPVMDSNYSFSAFFKLFRTKYNKCSY